jgi:hypothetical protein
MDGDFMRPMLPASKWDMQVYPVICANHWHLREMEAFGMMM